MQAGRMMLNRIKELVKLGETFAFETTLATRSYLPFLLDARNKGYTLTLVFFWLKSAEAAKIRVRERVLHQGHDIPEATTERRYSRGIQNLIFMYAPISHRWLVVNNSVNPSETVAIGRLNEQIEVNNYDIWERIKQQSNELTQTNRPRLR